MSGAHRKAQGGPWSTGRHSKDALQKKKNPTPRDALESPQSLPGHRERPLEDTVCKERLSETHRSSRKALKCSLVTNKRHSESSGALRKFNECLWGAQKDPWKAVMMVCVDFDKKKENKQKKS